MITVIDKIVKRLKRNPCIQCDYYNTSNNPKGWCQSKKVCNNGYGQVTWFDRLFCESYTGGYKMVDANGEPLLYNNIEE